MLILLALLSVSMLGLVFFDFGSDDDTSDPETPEPGTEDNDTITGTSMMDFIEGLGGDDHITALAGADQLDGGAGDDTIFAGNGNDSVLGGAGDDRLFGGAGDDVLDGGAGDDRIEGDDGNDTITAGTGTNVLYGDAGDDVLDGSDGGALGTPDTLYGGDGNDTLRGDDGDFLTGDYTNNGGVTTYEVITGIEGDRAVRINAGGFSIPLTDDDISAPHDNIRFLDENGDLIDADRLAAGGDLVLEIRDAHGPWVDFYLDGARVLHMNTNISAARFEANTNWLGNFETT